MGEQDLDKLLDDGQETTVMHRNATRQHLLEPHNLRQVAILGLQSSNRLLDDHMDVALLLGIAEVLVAKRVCVLFAPLLGEDEDTGRE